MVGETILLISHYFFMYQNRSFIVIEKHPIGVAFAVLYLILQLENCKFCLARNFVINVLSLGLRGTVTAKYSI